MQPVEIILGVVILAVGAASMVWASRYGRVRSDMEASSPSAWWLLSGWFDAPNASRWIVLSRGLLGVAAVLIGLVLIVAGFGG